MQTPPPPPPTPVEPPQPPPPPPPPPPSVLGRQLYVSPRLTKLGRPAAISGQPIGEWLGDWTPDVRAEANKYVTEATVQNKLAILVPYNIPQRDCGSHSAGGAPSSAAYRAWIRQLAAGIGNREAIVVLEPDVLGLLDCLSAADQAVRLGDITDAVNVFKTQTKAFVYIDAGNSGWKDVATMTDRLRRANVANAQGFALNVSNFQTTQSNAFYGDKIAQTLASAGIPDKKYVIDTSRNGRGPAPDKQWCNPPGRGLGAKPTTKPTIGSFADAYLWIKVPGESDGPCNGGPAAGKWDPAYAQVLITNAVY